MSRSTPYPSLNGEPIMRRDALKTMAIAGTALGLPGTVLLAGDAGGTDNLPWWKKAVVYQIYPRSFLDTNGDGIGDLPGITAKLDHLRDLGVDVVWLCPHFDSPNADNGYDIRDYRKVMAEFGTMADFDTMLAGMKQRGIRLIVDLVVNHTSDEHHWFTQSRMGPGNPYRDYYIWRDGKGDGPPNNYPSFFGGSAWARDGASGQWYLHYFGAKQPDLNWENPKVRAEVYDIMRFWLDKGVSGFRMDVIPFISKQPGLPDLTSEQLKAPQFTFASGPRLHEFLGEMRREVLSHYDSMSVGEAFGVTPAGARDLVDSRRGELDMVFNFDIVRLDRQGWRKTPWTLPDFKALYSRLDRGAGAHGWNSVFLSNHDNPRSVSHFGDDDPLWVERSARVIATLLLTQRGTPFLYQGEEIGMTNYPFTAITDYEDIEVRGQWHDEVESGKVSAADYLANLRQTSRDNARTPMQWTAGAQAGFTSGKPWLAINPNRKTINVADQAARSGSVFDHCRKLIAFRRAARDLVAGDYEDLAPAHPTLFVYRRGGGVLVILNFARDPADYPVPEGMTVQGLALATDPAAVRLRDGQIGMDGWQAAIFRIKSSVARGKA